MKNGIAIRVYLPRKMKKASNSVPNDRKSSNITITAVEPANAMPIGTPTKSNAKRTKASWNMPPTGCRSAADQTSVVASYPASRYSRRAKPTRSSINCKSAMKDISRKPNIRIR